MATPMPSNGFTQGSHPAEKPKPIEREPVSSSNLRSVGYGDGVLEVEFLNGSVYQYTGDGVYQLYRRLMAASSVGRFFEQNIAHNPVLKAQKVK